MRTLYLIYILCIVLTYNPKKSKGQTYEVLVSNRANNAVSQFDTNGNFLGDFVQPNDGGLSLTEDILFHPDGQVLVTGFGNSAIKSYDGSTGEYNFEFSDGYSLDQPSKMSIGPDSLIYVTQWGSGNPAKVVRFDLSGAFVDEYTDIPVSNGLGHIWDADGNFYIALYGSGSNGTVHKFDPNGNDLGTFINSAQLQGPTSIWWENSDMLVADWTVGNVLRYDSTGQYLGIFLTGMTSPEGIAFLPNGNFLIGDWGQDVVHAFDTFGNSLGPFNMGGNLQDPNSVKVRVSPATGVQELESGLELSYYPNPVQDALQISFDEMQQEVMVSLQDLNGRMISELVFFASERILVPMDVPSGVYQVMVETESSSRLLQVIKEQ